jgi:hypothetical protein
MEVPMLSIPAVTWLATARVRLRRLAKPTLDPTTCYCEEHPGTVRVGHVLCHADSLGEAVTSDLLICSDSLVLLDGNGQVILEIPRQRLRAVECAAPSGMDRHLPQSEQHLFVHFVNERDEPSCIEVSVGALDDTGPVQQMCEFLRSRLLVGTAVA